MKAQATGRGMTGRGMTGRGTLATVALAALLAGCGQGGTAPQDKAATPTEATAPAPAATTAPADTAATTAADTSVPDNLATNPQTALAALQGNWVGIEDPKSRLRVTGNQLVMGYEGDSSADETFRIDFVSECEGRAISGPRLGFTLTSEDMVLCYTDLDVDADNLEYFYAPRGNRQAFRRAR